MSQQSEMRARIATKLDEIQHLLNDPNRLMDWVLGVSMLSLWESSQEWSALVWAAALERSQGSNGRTRDPRPAQDLVSLMKAMVEVVKELVPPDTHQKIEQEALRLLSDKLGHLKPD